MKTSINFITFFMFTICAIIVVREVVIIVYDLAFSYDYIEMTVPSLITITVAIYLSEIFLVLMMSQSIKETTRNAQTRKHHSIYENSERPVTDTPNMSQNRRAESEISNDNSEILQ